MEISGVCKVEGEEEGQDQEPWRARTNQAPGSKTGAGHIDPYFCFPCKIFQSPPPASAPVQSYWICLYITIFFLFARAHSEFKRNWEQVGPRDQVFPTITKPQVNWPQLSDHPILGMTTWSLPSTNKFSIGRTWWGESRDENLGDSFLFHDCWDKGKWKMEKGVASLVLCCCSSATQPCLTLCDPMDSSRPGFPVLHHLPKFA